MIIFQFQVLLIKQQNAEISDAAERQHKGRDTCVQMWLGGISVEHQCIVQGKGSEVTAAQDWLGLDGERCLIC
jgi:hypothetical protein